MPHSPFAKLALAIVALLPATLSAHSHRSQPAIQTHRVIAREVHSSHAQHPQPAVFHSARLRGSHKRIEKTERTKRIHGRLSGSRRRDARYTPIALRSRSGARRDPLPVVRSSRHLIPQPIRASADASSIGASTIADPARPAAVVSVIRPTSDRPQLASVQQAATEPILLPTLYNERGRLIVPAPLVGSHEILVRQNELADQDGLGRVQDDADLEAMRARGMLVSLPVDGALVVDERLPSNRRYCRPWTAQFLATLARAHYARFHTPLQINSAVRTVAFQLHLQRINGNAAPAEGDTASPHLTGQTIDLAKRGLSLAEIAWMRGYLLPLIQSGRIDVEEEFQQSCFHISVYRRYLPADATPQHYSVASRATSALAVAIR